MSARVAVVEDHDLFRSVLRSAIENVDGYELAFETGEGADALEQLARVEVDVILIDVSLPAMSGIDVTAAVQHRWPEVACVLVSGHNNPLYVRSGLNAGAKAFVLKGGVTDLIDGIEAALRGDTYVSPSLGIAF